MLFSFSKEFPFRKNSMKAEKAQSGCVDALLVGHVGSRFTTSFMVMLSLLLQVRKVLIKLQMERKRTMHLLL
jgi:hypothetical protein